MAEEKSQRVIKIRVPKVNPWMVSTFVAIAIAVVIFLQPGALSVTGHASAVGDLTAEQAAYYAISWISDHNKALGMDLQVNLVEAFETESGIVEFTIIVTVGNEVFTDTLYVTKDGKLLFDSGIFIGEQIPAYNPQTPKTCDDIAKSQSPTLQAFVVSYCPYGVQMQRIMHDVVSSIPDLEGNIVIRYMGEVVDGKVTAMHGDTEATENLRQICIREEQADKYWKYVSCFIKEGNAEGCLVESGVSLSLLGECMEDSNRGVSYAQEDFAIQNSYMVSGSPTLIMNGEVVSEFDFGGRTSDAVKNLLCCGFTNQPNVCSNMLSTDQASSGFSMTYSGASGSGSC